MIHTVRIILYCFLFVFSFILLALCAARLHYTTHLSPFDPLNGGVRFYDHIVVELLVTSILTLFWSPFIARTIHGRHEHRFVNTFIAELIGLAILFLLWLVGAAIATNTGNPPDVNTKWGNLSSCWAYGACRVLTAMVAFAWLGWLLIFASLVITLLFAIANKAFREPMHGRWDPRATRYSQQMRNLP
ncbi:hypothetical protein BV22DRAFT_1103934 [Leucogyrophana mollusca]|uniref:Uncharacterized protein n=1 Tax=Leucogyrophana mollusca TaxID=85980 RepID=A0ACB8BN46_9AGAM|nr:hypothetical protein BV22DRAFT_1103934 [Leucogyrophana mollusca]